MLPSSLKRQPSGLFTALCCLLTLYAIIQVLETSHYKVCTCKCNGNEVETTDLKTDDRQKKVVPTYESQKKQAASLPQKKESTKASVGREFKERAANVRKVCQKLNLTSKKVTASNLKYLKKQNILYCPIQKVASTFWGKVLYVLSSNSSTDDPFSVSPWSAYGNKQFHKFDEKDNVTKIVQNSKSFLFVRDPFTRIFSGWLDKYFSTNPYYWKNGKDIIANERKNASLKSLNCGHDVSFQEFVSFTAQKLNSGKNIDGHFSPNFAHCRVCDLNFKYIGKYETLQQDSKYILEDFGMANDVSMFSNFEERSVLDMINDAADWVFSQKAGIEACMTFQCGLFRVWKRLTSRGVISKHFQYPYTTLDQALNLTKEEYVKDLINAHEQSDPSEIVNNRHEVLGEAFQSLSKETFEAMVQAFSKDFELFGYSKHPKFMDMKLSSDPKEAYLRECPYQ